MNNVPNEEELINAFINKGILKGWFLGQVPIGRKRLEQRGITHKRGRFYIDLICVEGVHGKKPMRFDPRYEDFILKEIKYRKIWLLEAKKELNAEVIGQLVIDRHLFPEDYPHFNIKGLGIICKISDEILEDICRRMRITVFRV